MLLELGFAAKPHWAVSATKPEKVQVRREAEEGPCHPVKKLDPLLPQDRFLLDDLGQLFTDVKVDHRQQDVAEGVADVAMRRVGALVGDQLEQVYAW